MTNKLWVEMLWKNGWVRYKGGNKTNFFILFSPPLSLHSFICLSSCGLFILIFFFFQSYDSSASLQTTAASPAIICWDPWVIYSLSPLLSSLAFIKPQMGCHASPSSLSCPVWKARPFRGDGGMRKRPEHSTREEGWPLCLHLPGATAPLRHWCGITVPERSRDRESAGRRWTREKSQALLRANPQEFGVFSLFDHILEPLNDVFGSKRSDPCIPMLRQCLTCSTLAVLQHRGVPYEWNPPVYVCVEYITIQSQITDLLLLKASYCAVLYLNRMPAKVFNVSARQHPLCAAAFLISVELFLACLCFLLLSASLTPPNGRKWQCRKQLWVCLNVGLQCNCIHHARRSAEFTCARAGYVGLQALA